MEEVLLQCPLFKNMTLFQIEAVLQKYPHQIKSYPEKDFIILQNDDCVSLKIITEGLVQTQMVDPAGKQIVIDELGVNQLLAPAFIFSQINKMPVSVHVVKHTEILSFHRSVLLNMMQENQTILLNFLSIISNRSRFLSEKVKFHAFVPLRGKIIHYLLEEYSIQKTLQIKLRHTQQELAERFGVARPSFARTLSDLEKEGLIEIKSKNVTIRNLEELKSNLQ